MGKYPKTVDVSAGLNRFFRPAAPVEKPEGLSQRCARKEDSGDIEDLGGAVSIIDPVSLARIENPVKGKNCQHLGAFDHDAYVEFNKMQERSKSCQLKKIWLCPLCGSFASEANLVVDIAMKEILDSAKEFPNI